MEGGTPPIAVSPEQTISNSTIDFDLVDEIISEGCWLETPDCSGLFEITETDGHEDLQGSRILQDRSSDAIHVESLDDGKGSFIENAVGIPNSFIQSGEFDSMNPSTKPGSSRWIEPKDPIFSVKERLTHALNCIKESQSCGDALVQVWVPIKSGDRVVLTTYDQPFSLNFNCKSLVRYRSVSTSYHFSGEENSNEAMGLPGRVFRGKMPEWTPDVRYFSKNEYPRVNHAERCDVRGTLAFPIFERDSSSCLGVVEVVTMARKVNYRYDLENICNALQAVNLRSSEVVSVPRIKLSNCSYWIALPEIQEVLRAACETHRLPLAQTWISCIQQGKKGIRHSDENYKDCVSTVNSSFYASDALMLEFHEACSEHHLFRGQGLVGRAFTMNQPCFSPDITSFSKAEYPLLHHAKLFDLRASVAIRLRNLDTGTTDFVLEFFLSVDCKEGEEQKAMLNSLSTTIQRTCQNLRVVTNEEIKDEAMQQVDEQVSSYVSFDDCFLEGGFREDPCVPLEYNKQEIEEFGIQTDWNLFMQHQQESAKDVTDHNTSTGEPSTSNVGKKLEKQRTRAEKTVSLEVLQQYFSGSLKDAAKSIGVCPTTLKRICRQYGITRWPSRKFKKVDLSLKKLQVVIDSVQGAERAFNFSHLFENSVKPSASENFLSSLSSKQKEEQQQQQQQQQQQARLFVSPTSQSNCGYFSSQSQSSRSSLAGSHDSQSEAKQEQEASKYKKYLKSRSMSPKHDKKEEMLKVKAMNGEEKTLFRLQPTWNFLDLKKEILRRFNIIDQDPVVIKYLDDDVEWVLLTCDDDLRECVHVYRSSRASAVKISVHVAQFSKLIDV